ncbi:MAG: GPR endopeptidase [Candidatus Fimenecus sp.]
MNCRTDLALERQELLRDGEYSGVKVKKWEIENACVTQIEITDKSGEEAIGKPMGKYITVDLPEFSHESELLDGRLTALTETVKELLPKGVKNVLVAGLGNESITPDALGPLCAKQIFATRHIEENMAKEMGLSSLNPVAAVSTGVLGQTGIETAEYIKGIAELVEPDAVIIVDALASRRLSRLGKTVQLSDTGITPGSGVGNARARIDESTIGVPVVAIGVPTVVDGATIVHDLTYGANKNENISQEADSMMVTPREIDTVISRAAKLLALSINCALQPQLEPELFLSL